MGCTRGSDRSQDVDHRGLAIEIDPRRVPLVQQHAVVWADRARPGVELGPMNPMLHSRHIAANFAFSERNPYPGWIACASQISAAVIIAGMCR